MFCPNCGAEIQDVAKFCPACGEPIIIRKNVQKEKPEMGKNTPIPQRPEQEKERTLRIGQQQSKVQQKMRQSQYSEPDEEQPFRQVPLHHESAKEKPAQSPLYLSPEFDERERKLPDDVMEQEPLQQVPDTESEPDDFEEQETAEVRTPRDGWQIPVYRYRESSEMHSLRFFGGVFFLVMLTVEYLQLLWSRMTEDWVRDELTLFMIIVNTASFLIPGLALLILRKPDRKRSLILAWILGSWSCVKILSFEIFSLVEGGIISELLWSRQNVLALSALDLPLLFCFVMTLLSIRQPERLVGTPSAEPGKKWKTISGIAYLGIASAMLLGAMLYMIFDDSGSSYSLAYFSMIGMETAALGGISILAGKGRRGMHSAYIFFNLAALMQLTLQLIPLWYSFERADQYLLVNLSRDEFLVILPVYSALFLGCLAGLVLELIDLRKRQKTA